MTKCIVTECERGRASKLGYCPMHWKRWHRRGTVEYTPPPKAGGPCSGPGCPRPSVARGYCGRHIQRIYRDIPLEETGSLPERFMGFVELSDEGCWLWKSTITHTGYGQFRFLNKVILAHRMAYELYVGAAPPRCCVCHRCDVRHCVRPDHLFLGTTSDNQRDRYLKGRHRVNPANLTTEGSR